jgi:hypothetical protein
MEKQLFEHDPFLGLTRIWYYDEATDTAVIETVQDATPIIERNKTLFNQTDERKPWKEDGLGTLVASIPMNVYADLAHKGITRDQAAMKKWLNDPENRHFRIRPGRV